MSARILCPACGALVFLRPVRPSGLWERSLKRLLGLRPYRCEACLSRILRRGLPVVAMTGHGPVDDLRARAPFVGKEGTDELRELVGEIAAAERRNSGRTSAP